MELTLYRLCRLYCNPKIVPYERITGIIWELHETPQITSSLKKISNNSDQLNITIQRNRKRRAIIFQKEILNEQKKPKVR
jgi:hypothetical protein